MQTVKVFNTHIHNLNMQETIALVEESIVQKKQLHHTVVNAGKIVALQTDQELRESVNNADVINADGQAVVWASKILKKPLKERVDRKSTRLNSSHVAISYAVFCLKKKIKKI